MQIKRKASVFTITLVPGRRDQLIFPELVRLPVSLLRFPGKGYGVTKGVSIRHQDQVRLFYGFTSAFFLVFSKGEIQYLVTPQKPFDKAGAYGIQEWIGHVGIHHIEGSYPNVVGLPVERVYAELKTLLAV